MKLDNFRLIVEVGQRRALWDSTMQLSIRKDVGALQWQEVANIMQMDVAVCKKRFKGLRDSYRSEIRKIQQKRSEHSNWPYFRALEFLRNIFDPDKLVPFSPVPFDIDIDGVDYEQNRLDDFIIDVDNDDSFDFEIMGDIFKRDSVEAQAHDSGSDMSVINRQHFDMSASNMSSNARSDIEQHGSSSPRLLSPLLPKPPAAKRTRRRKTSSSTDGPYLNGHATNVIKSTPVPPLETAAKDDPDYNFLISLLPHVKTLSSMNNMKFRTEVSRMLMEMNQQDMQPGQRGRDHATALPKLIPAPASNYDHEHDSTKYSMSGTLNGSAFLAHSSMIECDVKIENEPLF
ncbi:uncharacterized protein [Drosophila virilis]|uniref:MADF domain-containing protein n=1 Tax=Drosophila virilis TaxID=7244 RepID=B4LTU4_DROVI|nr:uncharacterized protein LOC6628505 [Drosophila virilis]EDW63995.1 uncharacterized protein Dvir_GJ17218 [Drosophila virilis]